MNEQPSTNLTEFFKKHPVSLNKRGKVVIDDFNMSGNGLAKKVFNRFFKEDRKELNNIKEDLAFKSETEICEELGNILPTTVDTLELAFREGLVEKASEGIELETNLQMYMDAIPIINMEDPRGGALMFHRETLRRLPIEETAWLRVVGKERAEVVMTKKRAGRFEYNPRSTQPTREVNEYGALETMFNKYHPPIHRVERDTSVKLHPVYIKFLETFFEDSCRDYAYNWMYHSLYNKLETYLTLVGAGGTGKNLLANSLKYLHGVSNFRNAPSSCLYKEFNSHLLDSTIVFYDECKFSGSNSKGSGKNRLKEWANSRVPVEAKGRDASDLEIFCSGIIATNNDSDIELEQLDRKFSVMELTSERLVDRIGSEESTKLWAYIASPEFPDAFLNFLESKVDPDFDIHKEHKGPRFDELVISSLKTWERSLFYDYLLSGDKMDYVISELAEEIPSFPTSAKLTDSLNNYRPGWEIIGEVKKINNTRVIRVIEKYRPTSEEGSL